MDKNGRNEYGPKIKIGKYRQTQNRHKWKKYLQLFSNDRH